MTQPMDSSMDEFFNFTEASYQQQLAVTEPIDAFPDIPFNQSNDENYLPPEIWDQFGFKEEEPGAKLEYSNFTKWLPTFSRPKFPCAYCQARHLECWFTYEGQQDCSACKALFRPCSFTFEQRPDVFMDTMHTITEDVPQNEGGLTGTKALRCFDRTPMDRPNSVDDERMARKSSTRFPREAISSLKKWVEQHREHPYPSEEQKEELSQLTGLNLGQISNWFANFRRRSKQRTRGVSPSLRSPSSSSSSESIPIPTKRSMVFEGKVWEVMNPLDRWRASPPENEPASVTAIANAMASFPDHSNDSNLSRSQSRHNLTSSGASGSFSVPHAPSITSLETGQSESQLSSGSFSNLSLGSSRSQHSRGSGVRKDRRRRRKPTNLSSAVNQMQNRPYQCTFCTDTFRTKYDWTRHEKSLHLSLEKWICAPLGGVIACPSTGKLKCVYCGAMDPSEDHVEKHNHSTCSEKPIDGRTFYRKDHLRQHLRLVHGCKMIDSMESWKSEATYIKSRCGFCAEEFTSWSERCDHLARHFRAGANMKDWKGCRGLDDEVARYVTNAMPAFLIGNEASSPVPFSATNGPCCNYPITFSQNSLKLNNTTGDLSTPEQLVLWNQAIECPTSLVPGFHSMGQDIGETITTQNHALQSFDSIGVGEVNMTWPVGSNVRISTCWEILTLRLGHFVQEKLQEGIPITDDILQRQARWILYESDDNWNQTAADNPEWLELFKKAHGLPSSSTDEQVDIREDLGVGDLSFDLVVQDGNWDTLPGNFNDLILA